MNAFFIPVYSPKVVTSKNPGSFVHILLLVNLFDLYIKHRYFFKKRKYMAFGDLKGRIFVCYEIKTHSLKC